MSDARSKILSRMRAALGEAEPRRAAVDGRLTAHAQSAPTPRIARLDGRERIDFFIDRAELSGATVTRLTQLRSLPQALEEELARRHLPLVIRIGQDPEFEQLDWEPIATRVGPAGKAAESTMSVAFSAIAETGTLALLSGPENPVTLTFLGETHFILLRASRIEAGFEGLWTKLRAANRNPRTVNLVTGPSRTADIGQRLELGAHGPIALHLFLIDDY